MFIVDGLQWDIPVQISRQSEVRASSISGFLLDKTYFNDVIGTYLNYDVTIAVPFGSEEKYYKLYNILTDPVGEHVFVLPYNNSDVTVTARIEDVSDDYVRMPQDGQTWRRTTFSVIASHPTKTKTLDGVLLQGRAPFPEIAKVSYGDMYIFTDDGWKYIEYENADEIYW